MTILHSAPLLAVLLVSLGLALLARQGILPRVTGLLSVCCASGLPVLMTAQGGTLQEALLCLGALLLLLMPKEKSS